MCPQLQDFTIGLISLLTGLHLCLGEIASFLLFAMGNSLGSLNPWYLCIVPEIPQLLPIQYYLSLIFTLLGL